MPARRSSRVRAGLAAAALAALGAALGPGIPGRGAAVRPASAAPAPVPLPDRISLEVRYAGQGGEGVDLIWRGVVGGAVPGRVAIRVEYAGPSSERAMRVWPVNAWLFFSADDLSSSFAAELSGSMNWQTGELRVTGLVSDGVRLGTPVEQRMQVTRPGLEGRVTVSFLSPLALLVWGSR